MPDITDGLVITVEKHLHLLPVVAQLFTAAASYGIKDLFTQCLSYNH